jgi:hypothetical protein
MGWFRVLSRVYAIVAADVWLFPQAVLLPGLAFVGIRLAGVARTQKWLRKWATSPVGAHPAGEPHVVMTAVLRAHRIVRRYSGVSGSCLIRAFTLWALLGRRGVKADIRIGIRKEGGTIEGHAWLEYEGIPVDQTEAILQTYSAYPESIAFDRWRFRRRTAECGAASGDASPAGSA